MKVQTFGCHTKEIVIDTPEGPICIDFSKRGKLFMKLPGDLTAHNGFERALAEARFTARSGSVFVPSYELLLPRIDDHGALIGIEKSKLYRTPKLAVG